MMAANPLIVIEQCKSCCDTLSHTIHDTIRHDFFDTTHISLDSVVTFGAFDKVQSYFNEFYANVNGTLSTATTWISVLFAIITILCGLKILWDYKGGIKVFRLYVKKVKSENAKAIENFKIEFVSSYVKIGTVLCSKKMYKESFDQFYLALNYLSTIEYKKANKKIYEELLNAIAEMWKMSNLETTKIIFQSLNELEEKVSAEKDLLGKIKRLSKELEMDDSECDVENESMPLESSEDG